MEQETWHQTQKLWLFSILLEPKAMGLPTLIPLPILLTIPITSMVLQMPHSPIKMTSDRSNRHLHMSSWLQGEQWHDGSKSKLRSHFLQLKPNMSLSQKLLQFSLCRTSYLFFPLISYYIMLSSPDPLSFSHASCLTHFSVVILLWYFLKGPFTDSHPFTL